MNKIKLLIAVMCLTMLGACSENDDFNGIDLQDNTITIKATIEGQDNLTKAGIVEGNANYEGGESFYWKDGDQIRLYFVKDGNAGGAIPSSAFKATNVNGKNADFTGEVPQGLNGTYTVYASKDVEQTGTSAELKGTLLQEQSQTGASSNGIKLPMLSLAIQNIDIVNGVVADTKALNFSLKQLNSLLRFTIENNASQAMTVEKITVSVEDAAGNAVKAFANTATVSMKASTDIKWDNAASPSLEKLALTVVQDGGKATIAKGNKFDAYLSVLPSEGLTQGNNFVVEITLKGADGKNYVQKKKVTIANNGSFSFLASGFKAGMRYYFVSELTDSNLEKLRKSYTITFEDTYYDDYVIHKNYPGVTSTTNFASYGGGEEYPNWTDPITSLSVSRRPGKEGAMAIAGYPWFVSSYNSNSLDTGTYGYYTHDFYVYNEKGEENSTTGGGNNGSNNFITTFGYQDTNPQWTEMYGDGRPILSFEDKKPRTVKGLYVNSTNYFIAVALAGNPLSPPLAEGEDVILIATGYDADDNEVGTTKMTFATVEKAVKEWTYWDLSSLGDIVMLKINMAGGTDNGYGFSLPAYYAVDDITVEWEE